VPPALLFLVQAAKLAEAIPVWLKQYPLQLESVIVRFLFIDDLGIVEAVSVSVTAPNGAQVRATPVLPQNAARNAMSQ
jgi:hypothetical protein